jgi:hypothetical protein
MIGALLVAALGATVAAPAPEPPAYLGIVIGFNRSSRPHQAPLRYADDDALQNAALLARLGAETEFLAELDDDTRRLHPEARPIPPTLANLEAAVARLDARAEALHRAGRRVEWFLFYGGHGDVENNEGRVELDGGQLTRTRLRRLLAGLEADRIHLVVDACKSYFLVHERGGDDRRPVPAGPWPSLLPGLRPEVGLMLSTSSDQDSHEWEALEAGIFSHEVRSALLGGADLDGDGVVRYVEVGAFVEAANAPIANARFRPRVHVRPPAGDGAVLALADLGGDPADLAGLDGHHWLEDARGVRLADLHPAPSLPLRVIVPGERPLFLHRADGTAVYPVASSGAVRLGDLAPEPSGVGRRGAVHLAFQRLFSAPIGAANLASYRATGLERAAPALERRPAWLAPSLLGAGLALGGSGAAALAVSTQVRAGAEDASQVERQVANGRLRALNVAGGVLVGAAVTALGGWLWTSLTAED